MQNRFHSLIRLDPHKYRTYVSQGRTVLCVAPDGFMDGRGEEGLFVDQTRMISKWRYRINRNAPIPVVSSNVEQNTWLGYYIIRMLPSGVSSQRSPDDEAEAAQQTLELRLSRYVGDGMHEDIDLTNYSAWPAVFQLRLDLDSDFADILEARGRRKQEGQIRKEWKTDEKGVPQLDFRFAAQHHFDHQGSKGATAVEYGLTVQVKNASSLPNYRNRSITFEVEIASQADWHACLELIPRIERETFLPLYTCLSFQGINSENDRRRQIFLEESTQFTSERDEGLKPVVVAALERAKRDLVSLRLYDLDEDERTWVIAAGIPSYLGLYGRDMLTASWQAAMVSTGMIRGALGILARLQGREVNEWRDEQPGRMLHEARSGPLSRLNFIPHARYYGSVTTSGFYPFVLSELWHWTGNKEFILPLLEPAMKALKWLDDYADRDHDGLYEYKTMSEQGLENQGWKDSGDAIVYEDGSQVKAPISTCEEQGFVYVAKLHLSEVLWWCDRKEEAKRLHEEATELKKRFNDKFWMDDQGFFAMGLDSQKRQIASIGSNAGHCIASGIVDESLVQRAADRLLADDLFTGWGIRTLSSRHPAFNPYSYHRGSVWPVEQGTFAIGLMRYGLHRHVDLICHSMFEAAGLFSFYRFPELFAGHQRDAAHPFPAFYPEACAPQAWSSSAVFSLIQALLGIYPYAPLNMLFVDPHLPDWLPELEVRNLHVGKATVSLRFRRKKDGTSDYDVLDTQDWLHIIRQPSPWSLTATFAERMKDILTSL